MSVLSDQFARLRRAIPPNQHEYIKLSLWVRGDEYCASCSVGGGGTGGVGATPEEALRGAVGAVIQSRSR